MQSRGTSESRVSNVVPSEGHRTQDTITISPSDTQHTLTSHIPLRHGDELKRHLDLDEIFYFREFFLGVTYSQGERGIGTVVNHNSPET